MSTSRQPDRAGLGPAFAALSLLAACSPGLEVLGANHDQRFLCEGQERDDFDAILQDCRARWEVDESCAGVISYRGILDGQPVIFGGEVILADWKNFIRPDDSVVRNGVSMVGEAPTYQFELKLIDIGIEGAQSTDFPPYEAAPVQEILDDYIVDATFRLVNGFQSDDLRVVDGILLVNLYTDDEFAADFHMSFGTGSDVIEGCVHALATSVENDALVTTGDGGETGW